MEGKENPRIQWLTLLVQASTLLVMIVGGIAGYVLVERKLANVEERLTEASAIEKEILIKERTTPVFGVSTRVQTTSIQPDVRNFTLEAILENLGDADVEIDKITVQVYEGTIPEEEASQRQLVDMDSGTTTWKRIEEFDREIKIASVLHRGERRAKKLRYLLVSHDVTPKWYRFVIEAAPKHGSDKQEVDTIVWAGQMQPGSDEIKILHNFHDSIIPEWPLDIQGERTWNL